MALFRARHSLKKMSDAHTFTNFIMYNGVHTHTHTQIHSLSLSPYLTHTHTHTHTLRLGQLVTDGGAVRVGNNAYGASFIASITTPMQDIHWDIDEWIDRET